MTTIKNLVDIGDPDDCGWKHYVPYDDSVTLVGPIFELKKGAAIAVDDGMVKLEPGFYRFARLPSEWEGVQE